MATSSFGESRDWGNISLCWGTGCAVRAELNNGPYFKIWLSKLTAYGIAFIIQHECVHNLTWMRIVSIYDWYLWLWFIRLLDILGWWKGIYCMSIVHVCNNVIKNCIDEKWIYFLKTANIEFNCMTIMKTFANWNEKTTLGHKI